MKTFCRALPLAALAVLSGAATCLAQPANDLCSQAEFVPVVSGSSGSFSGNNSLATDDPGFPACVLSASASNGNKAVWYTFTGTGNRVEFSSCGQSLDLTFHLFCGTCDSPVCAASDDDGCVTNSLGARLAVCTTAGTPYILKVQPFGTGAGGAFTIEWSDNGVACPASGLPQCTGAPAVNDECFNAIPLTIGSSAIGTTIDATPESTVPPTCNSVSVGNAVWYSFVGDGRTVIATTCSAVTGSNTRVAVYTGACGSFTCVGGGTSQTCAAGGRDDTGSAVAVCTSPGQTYYVAVSSDTNGAGLFELTLVDNGDLGCAPPPNDLCENATVIPPNTTSFSSQVSALAATHDIDVGCNAGANTELRHGVWYQFNATEPGALTFIESSTADVVFTVFSSGGDCNSLFEEFCTDAETGGAPFTVNPGTTYYILMGMWSASSVPPPVYNLTINFAGLPGACCVGSMCTITNGSGACAALGGTFLGAGVECGGEPLPENTNSSQVAIPDFPGPDGAALGAPAVTSVNIADTSPVTDVDVWVTANHTWVGDVYLVLQGPNGAMVDLVRSPTLADCTPGNVGSGDDFFGTFIFDDDASQTVHDAVLAVGTVVAPGRYIPATCNGAITSLDSTFAGIPANGTWTLFAYDTDQALTGTIDSFGLVINGVAQPSPCDSPAGGACCQGSTCVASTSGACTGPNTSFAGDGTVCNTFGVNNTAPCCLADYNHIGGVTVQDIFDFLGGYFSQNPLANINGVGGVTVQDIFDFLGTYFAGCN